MKGNQEVIDHLNIILTMELTAINQYFLHSRILQNWGMEKLGQIEYKASVDEMKHADSLIKRILLLEGLPNVQRYNQVKIGQDIVEIIESDLKVEEEAIPKLKEAIKKCEEVIDYGTRDLLVAILNSEEEHLDWLESQKNLILTIGKERYIQSQIEMETTAP
jgi:bacterioferritin